jgi:hypothetical protein
VTIKKADHIIEKTNDILQKGQKYKNEMERPKESADAIEKPY